MWSLVTWQPSQPAHASEAAPCVSASPPPPKASTLIAGISLPLGWSHFKRFVTTLRRGGKLSCINGTGRGHELTLNLGSVPDKV